MSSLVFKLSSVGYSYYTCTALTLTKFFLLLGSKELGSIEAALNEFFENLMNQEIHTISWGNAGLFSILKMRGPSICAMKKAGLKLLKDT